MKVPIIGGIFRGVADVTTGIKQSQQFQKGKALLIMKNYSCYILNGVVSDDLLFFIPIGLKRKYKIEGMYNLYPKNEKFFIIMDEGVETIDLKKIPKIRKFIKPEVLHEIKNDKLIETVSLKEYAIKGADELSAMAFLTGKTVALKHMEEASKREILFIMIISVVTGILLGIIGAFTFISSNTG